MYVCVFFSLSFSLLDFLHQKFNFDILTLYFSLVHDMWNISFLFLKRRQTLNSSGKKGPLSTACVCVYVRTINLVGVTFDGENEPHLSQSKCISNDINRAQS